ncbi:hypothetical protein AVEN_263732-1 [Araneus ventricosus]|uniref:Uncharacterized protein n=1 Tax=Araneus ventricosus TaxID=182803 RepID=A0A4Y2AS85_ARAVE|nr:hypothetical protein AVEN_263732-1 [Araneus ventricosus]
MHTILYSAKKHTFSKQLKYGNSKIQKLHQICLFKYMSFVKVWFNAQNSEDTPVNDLMLCESLNMYEKYELGVARAGLLTFSRHWWYLTEEAVAFSLFSKKLSNSEKKKEKGCSILNGIQS